MNGKNIYKVFIAEDEAPARDLLVNYLLTRSELQLCGMAKDGKEALEKILHNSYDLVLLDIHLPTLSGIELLNKLENSPCVIFISAHDKYAIKAFDIGAVDYLLKPFSLERFHQSIEKFVSIKKKGNSNSAIPLKALQNYGFAFKERGRHHLIPYQEVIYIMSHAKKTLIHTEEKTYEASMILREAQERLPAEFFLRIHKQYILNLQFISMIEYYIGGQYLAFLKDNEESTLPVGRKYVSTLKERLNIS